MKAFLLGLLLAASLAGQTTINPGPVIGADQRWRFTNVQPNDCIRRNADNTFWVNVTSVGCGGGGTVASVGLSAPAIFTVAGSPITSTGTLSLSLASQIQNYVWAAPSGASGTPIFRLLVEGDIPALSAAKITSGTFGDARIAASNVTQHQAALSIGWAQLTGVPPTFAPTAHALVGADHSASGLTTGHLLKATGATSFGFAPVAETDLADMGCAVVAFSATPAFNASAASCFEITLTGAVTSSTLTGELPGRTLSWTITQNLIGGHPFVWPIEVGDACTVATAANAVTLVEARVDSAGVTVTSCRLKGGPDAWTFKQTSGAALTAPPAGSATAFYDTDTGEYSVKKSGGSVVSLESGGGGSSTPAGVRVTFTAQTSATITHNFGTLAYAVQCFDGSNQPIIYNNFSTRTTTTATVQFGSTQTGDCVAIPGGVAGPYVSTFLSTTSLTVTGATHGKACATTGIDATIYDNSAPRQMILTTPTVDFATTCNVVWTFDLATAGLVVIQ